MMMMMMMISDCNDDDDDVQRSSPNSCDPVRLKCQTPTNRPFLQDSFRSDHHHCHHHYDMCSYIMLVIIKYQLDNESDDKYDHYFGATEMEAVKKRRFCEYFVKLVKLLPHENLPFLQIFLQIFLGLGQITSAPPQQQLQGVFFLHWAYPNKVKVWKTQVRLDVSGTSQIHLT